MLGLDGGGLSGLWAQIPGTADHTYLELLREARAELGARHPLATQLASREAVELHNLGRMSEAHELSATVLSCARAEDGESALRYALAARAFAIFGPDHLAEHRALAQELVGRAEDCSDLEVAFTGHLWLLANGLASGDYPLVEASRARCESIAGQLGQPRTSWFIRRQQATRALMDGRHADAERLAHEAFAIGRTVQEATALQALAAQLAFVRAAQGRLAEPLPELDPMRETFGRIAAWRAWLAFRHAMVGELDDAAAVLAPLTRDRLARIPRDESWLIALVNVGRAAVLLNDLDTVSVTYELLVPHADCHVVAGVAVAYGGPVMFFLGNLAAALGDLDAAQHHLSAAIPAAGAMRSPPWDARARVSLAHVLLRTGDPGLRPRALALLEDGLTVARRLGLAELTGATTSLEPSETV